MTNFNPSSSQFSPSQRQIAANQKRLEQLYRLPHAPRSETSNQMGWLKQAGTYLLAFLTGDQQVRVWSKTTREGLVWFAYDPATERSISRVSEEALRVWLEERYQR